MDSGFSEEQIPRNDCPEGFVPLEVRGLCAAGDTDVNVATVGYVVLLRGDGGIQVCISIGQNYFQFFSNLHHLLSHCSLKIYAVEFFFGLLISPYYNLSINPGFEAFIGVNNHQKDDDIIYCVWPCSDI
jgi:hypothetical protein